MLDITNKSNLNYAYFQFFDWYHSTAWRAKGLLSIWWYEFSLSTTHLTGQEEMIHTLQSTRNRVHHFIFWFQYKQRCVCVCVHKNPLEAWTASLLAARSISSPVVPPACQTANMQLRGTKSASSSPAGQPLTLTKCVANVVFIILPW